MTYKYKKDLSKDEWDKIVTEARQQKQEMLSSMNKEDGAVGKATPELPRGEWLNSNPAS